MKTCVSCKTDKPLDDFPRRTRSRDGRHSYCRPCNNAKSLAWQRAHPVEARALQRKSQMRRRNNLLPELYDQMLVEQEHKCRICGEGQSWLQVRLCIDHDHETGRIRGLLCHPCNRGIGMFSDDPARLRVAAEYLERATCAL